MKKHLLPLVAIAALAPLGTELSAATLTVGYEPGTAYTTTGLTGYGTTGGNMDGLEITAVFADGTSEVVTWGATALSAGGVSGTGWSLTQSRSTFSNPWTLTSTAASLTRLVLDSGTGDSVFDLTSRASTTDSASGRTFSLNSLNLWDLAVTYSDLVSLSGAAAVGDLYRTLTIDFLGDTPFSSGQRLRFLADTDNLLYANDITPVPLPAAAWLFGTGLIAMAGLRRRRGRT